jgi:putative ABC transport system ATP-binding protein
MTATPPLVALRRVSKTYRQKNAVPVHALHPVDLEIASGEFTALVGPSGSGKTTLLNLVGALDEPDEGEIVIGGDMLGTLASRAIAALRLNRLGFVFQDFNLLPVLSAIENVEYVLVLQGVPATQRRERARTALEAVGLGGHLHRRPHELSGGQQQRVAVARAIVGEPLLVLADEPTGSLDSETGAALMDLMQQLNRERGTTFVFSTHDPAVMRRAKRVVRLQDGHVVEDQRDGA